MLAHFRVSLIEPVGSDKANITRNVFNTAILKSVLLKTKRSNQRMTRMTTKAIHGKSQVLAARVPLEVVRRMQKVRKEGESIGQFVFKCFNREISSICIDN